ncbi:hypothetical protein HG530_001417 [Fusarium avenaceum]|nr:hypothetical protein HG530_001417 [Fusarium avenaceum]
MLVVVILLLTLVIRLAGVCGISFVFPVNITPFWIFLLGISVFRFVLFTLVVWIIILLAFITSLSGLLTILGTDVQCFVFGAFLSVFIGIINTFVL